MKFNRIFLIVLDSLGIGETNDAASYGDEGSNTLKHIEEAHPLFIPNLKKLGFMNTLELKEQADTEAYYTMARPINKGKDTITGHYEIMGIRSDVGFKTFAETGFPRELIEEIEQKTGRRVIGNKASKTIDIIRELGDRQMQYGSLIIYTSDNSIMQVAAHEDVIPVDLLYKYCEIIRKITEKEEWKIGNVIARPFSGTQNTNFKPTTNRKEFALDPPMKSVMSKMVDKKLSVIGIGKVNEIFNGNGISKKIVSSSNKEGIDKIIDIMDKKFTGLCFANLNDFDSVYGHNRDVEGYANAIEELDVEIPMILNKLNNDDLLIITADHGNDPTFKGNDHTRENVPVIIYSRIFKNPKLLPAMTTLADVGATIADNFDVDMPMIGTSYLSILE